MFVDVKTPVLLQTAVTAVYNKARPDDAITARLILDSGSQKSYVCAKLKNDLNLPVEQSVAVSIKTFGSETERVQSCDIVKLGLRTKTGTDIELTLYAVPFICEPLTGQAVDTTVEHFPYLAGLDLADSRHSGNNLEISILIGADYYWKVTTGRIIRGQVGPTAVETRFGWVLSGPVPGCCHGSETTNMNILCSHVLNIGCASHDDLAKLDRKLQAFWDLEGLGIKKEESIYDNFTRSVSFQDGRYCVRLPWKEPHPFLPDNYHLSRDRLFNLLKRLRQTPEMLSQYDAIMRDQIKNNIVEVVESPCNGPAGKTHYLPHHAVIREDKQTTKLRIVYDASAKSDGPSLNDCLYAGPTFGQNIMDILLRFRLFRVAVTADVEKAFLMVSVAEEDHDALQFLWVEDIHSQFPRVITLRFARVVFGVSASPFLLNATLRHHIENYREGDPAFVDRFIRSIYVDDLTSGADTEDEALSLYTRARVRLAQAGFNLRKFVSNSMKLQNHVYSQEPQSSSGMVTTSNLVMSDEESYTKNTLGDKLDGPECVKVLGVKWRPVDDRLLVDISGLCSIVDGMMPTKRNIIGLSARIYDPLGILSPVTVCFKMLFQDICAAKLEWDEPLSGDLLSRWEHLTQGLRQSQSLCVPRCYFQDVVGTSSCSLVGFCDASQKAYAAVVFLKIRTGNKSVARFVASKTRVAPIGMMTIPRLELLAALLLARLLSSITSAILPEQVLDKPMCFTDSMIALHWIRGFDKEWRQFVQNRVIEIRSLVSFDCWYHCPGEDNPADIPSRGIDLSLLISSTLWLMGPTWICDPEFEPQCPDPRLPPDECLSEMRVKDRLACSNLLIQGSHQGGAIIDCERFSTLRRLLKVTAYVMKFVSLLKSKVRKSDPVTRTITAVDVENAELFWVRLSQGMLTEDERFGTWQQQLGLYSGNDGVWRCQGRLHHADLPQAGRHPIILDKRHHFTVLVVQDCHTKVMHNGVKETLTELRSRYWIVRGRQFVRKLLIQVQNLQTVWFKTIHWSTLSSITQLRCPGITTIQYHRS